MDMTTARSARWSKSLAAVGLLALMACGNDSDDADDADIEEVDAEVTRGEQVASPQVTGPITGGERGLPFNPMPARLAEEYGYVEEEFFLSGDATAYESEGDWDDDGEWAAIPTETAPYQTRILVRRPADPDAFNGTVVVELLNVTSGMDQQQSQQRPRLGARHPQALVVGDHLQRAQDPKLHTTAAPSHWPRGPSSSVRSSGYRGHGLPAHTPQ